MGLTHFGFLISVNLINGMCTPLLGVWLFVYSSIAKISLKDHMRDLLPMPGVLFVVLLFATYIPGPTLWLPGLFDYVDSSYRSGDLTSYNCAIDIKRKSASVLGALFLSLRSDIFI